jgi:diaminobutyrate acetyltransferase
VSSPSVTTASDAGGPAPRLRPFALDDGPAVHALVAEGGGLDVNSPYAYVLAARFFADSSVIAEGPDGPEGFVLGVRPPAEPDTLFVWQVGVAPSARGRGHGLAMLRWLVDEARPTHLEATVTPSNTASQRLFRALARDVGAPIEVRRWADSDQLGGAEAEDLHRIGPIPRA